MVLSKRCKAVERYMLVITGLAAVAFIFSYMGYAPVFSVLPTKKGTGGLNDDENWNLFYHLGGNGPWIPKIDDVVPGGVDVPVGCSIDQAHMISRHAERYPTHTAGHLELLSRFRNLSIPLQGSLKFVKDWKYFTNVSSPEFEDLTTSGPYAGTQQALATGELLRKRYGHLVRPDKPLKFWSCGSSRDVETAKWFAEGFFGSGWESSPSARLEVIEETPDRGANTLTPGKTCRLNQEDAHSGRDNGYSQMHIWMDMFTGPIIQRLEGQNAGISLEPMEVYSMMDICGFEILARGDSPWCDVFTHEEWLDFEYARDVLHFYRSGPGNRYAGAMGMLWLEATNKLLLQDTDGEAYFSFVHDGDIVPVLAALGFFHEDCPQEPPRWRQLPLSKHLKRPLPYLNPRVRDDKRLWKTSDLVPMSGRMIIERLQCEQHHAQWNTKQYIRIIINDGVLPLGSKGLYPLPAFDESLRTKAIEFGDFREVCGLNSSVPDKITFLHQ